MADQDTEITLGTGKLLGLFFGLVALCGVFFVMGYSLGRNTSPATTTLTAEPTVPAAVPAATAAKPAATQGVVPKQDCASTPEGCAATGDDAAQNTPQPTASDVPATAAPMPVATKTPVSAPEQKPTAPEVAKNALPAGYIVQVAAVTKQQDAEALVAALRRKQYPVFIANGSADTLFHVQIGPFADPKDAEAMRSRLVADGYNPILKK